MKEKRDDLNSVRSFTQETGARIRITHSSTVNLNSNLKMVLLSNAILTFFLGMVFIFILHKIIAQRGRLQAFFAFAVILGQIFATEAIHFFLW